MTITEFLLAQIAEDEAEARDDDGTPTPVGMWDPDRVLAECEAKRRIVQEHDLTDYNGKPSCWLCAPEFSWGKEPTPDEQPCGTLRALASVYADRPDFDSAWRA